VLARMIHEASAANADTRLRRAVSPFSPSTYCRGLAPFFLVPVPVRGAGQAPPQTAEPVPGLRVPVSLRVRTLSQRTFINNAGYWGEGNSRVFGVERVNEASRLWRNPLGTAELR
jgi:hypothetical protein